MLQKQQSAKTRLVGSLLEAQSGGVKIEAAHLGTAPLEPIKATALDVPSIENNAIHSIVKYCHDLVGGTLGGKCNLMKYAQVNCPRALHRFGGNFANICTQRQLVSSSVREVISDVGLDKFTRNGFSVCLLLFAQMASSSRAAPPCAP